MEYAIFGFEGADTTVELLSLALSTLTESLKFQIWPFKAVLSL
jgi:hypothetical protein